VGKDIALKCDIAKTLKHVKKHTGHLDEEEDFTREGVEQLVTEMLEELEVGEEDSDYS